MKRADVDAKQQHERDDWQKRSVGGPVTAVDPAAKTISISVTAIGGKKSVAVNTTPKTVFRRYAPDSVKFDDAKPSSLDQVKPGDQLRALGTRSADGSTVGRRRNCHRLIPQYRRNHHFDRRRVKLHHCDGLDYQKACRGESFRPNTTPQTCARSRATNRIPLERSSERRDRKPIAPQLRPAPQHRLETPHLAHPHRVKTRDKVRATKRRATQRSRCVRRSWREWSDRRRTGRSSANSEPHARRIALRFSRKATPLWLYPQKEQIPAALPPSLWSAASKQSWKPPPPVAVK